MLSHVTVPMMLMMRSDGSTSATSSLTRAGQLPHLPPPHSTDHQFESYPTTTAAGTYTVGSHTSGKGVIVSPGRHHSHRHHLHHHHHPLATVSVIEEELSTVSTPLMSSQGSNSPRVINPRESAVWSLPPQKQIMCDNYKFPTSSSQRRKKGKMITKKSAAVKCTYIGKAGYNMPLFYNYNVVKKKSHH